MNSRFVTVLLAVALLAGLGAVVGLVISGGDRSPEPRAPQVDAAEPAPSRAPRKRRAKYPEFDALWARALQEFAAGRPADALALLRDARASGHRYFDDAGRQATLAKIEEEALAELERAVKERRARAARELAGVLGDLLSGAEQKARAAGLIEELARRESERRDDALRGLAASSKSKADREQMERHLERFGADAVKVAGKPGKPGKKARPADWVDRLVHGVKRRRRTAVPAAPLPIADEDAAAARRLEQLEKLRRREAVGLLDHIHAALAWLALHQAEDGRMADDAVAARCKELGHGKTPCADKVARYSVASTALSVLAFLDFRDQDAAGLFEPSLSSGVNWLLAQQRSDGSFPQVGGYTPPIVLMALGQAASSSGREDVRSAVRKGLEHYTSAAGPGGGFRYRPRDAGDSSVTGWWAQALEAARDAGVPAPPTLAAGLDRFVRGTEQGESGFSYLSGQGPRKSLQSVGMLSSLILRDDHGEARLDAWREGLAKWPPERKDARKGTKQRKLRLALYTLYYDVRVQLALDGRLSPGRRQEVFVLAEDYQFRDGSRAGMFDLKGGKRVGRAGAVVATAFSALTLEHALYRR